jgi:hypothetical protein
VQEQPGRARPPPMAVALGARRPAVGGGEHGASEPGRRNLGVRGVESCEVVAITG